MWILRYKTNSNGSVESQEHSSWLIPNKKYTIGRDSSSTFHFASSKVSKKHITLQVIPSDDPADHSKLRLEIIGRQSKVGDEALNRRLLPEKEQLNPTIRIIEKSTTVTLGKAGEVVEFERIKFLFKLQNGVELDLENMRALDMNYTFKYLKYVTHLVVSDLGISNTTLDAMITQKAIVEPSLITYIIDHFDSISTDFFKCFPKAEDFLPDSNAKVRPERSNIFDGVSFVFGDEDQKNALDPLLEHGKAKVSLAQFDSKQELLQFIQSNLNDSDKVVIVSPNIQNTESNVMKVLNEAAEDLGKYLVTPEDIFNSVKDVNIQSLFRTRIPKKSVSPTIIDPPPSKKPKTVRRPTKVRALDSLDFFAGGGKFESSQLQPTPVTQVSETMSIPESIEEPPKKKKQRSRIQSLPNQMLDTNFKPSMGSIPESASLEVSQTQDQSPGTEESVSVEAKKDKENVPANQEPKVERQQSFHNAVINAKKSAQQRIETQLGGDEIITPETIENLQNLAIVEVINIPLRENRKLQSQSQDPKWAGRKNFKTFVKNTSNKARKDQSFLYTREFVPMESFDPKTLNSMQKGEAEFIRGMAQDEAEDQADEVNPAESFAFRNNNNSNDSLRQPTVVDPEPQSRPKSRLFVVSDSEEEDDGLGWDVRKDEIENVPEFRRDQHKEPDEPSRQKEAIAKHTPIPVEEDDDEDESDDDDDETPKFRFRS